MLSWVSYGCEYGAFWNGFLGMECLTDSQLRKFSFIHNMPVLFPYYLVILYKVLWSNLKPINNTITEQNFKVFSRGGLNFTSKTNYKIKKVQYPVAATINIAEEQKYQQERHARKVFFFCLMYILFFISVLTILQKKSTHKKVCTTKYIIVFLMENKCLIRCGVLCLKNFEFLLIFFTCNSLFCSCFMKVWFFFFLCQQKEHQQVKVSNDQVEKKFFLFKFNAYYSTRAIPIISYLLMLFFLRIIIFWTPQNVRSLL